MTIKFYNTMSRSKEEFTSLKDNQVKMYTCGPTVYNYAHVGNFRAYIFEDILRRTLKYYGYKVTQVMNLTDVDDKTIRDSQVANVPLLEFTKKYKDAFFEDIESLKIEKAEVYPAATDHIKEMVKLIQVLLGKKYAYQTDDGSIYFSISKFPEYGNLARIDMENQRAGSRVKNDEYEKDSIADFALWKAWDKSDGDVYWDSPWGKGRPGWHIECSAMSMKYLGRTFDIHTGGIDNMFPHHEDEIAQSECANGVKFVNYWLHCEYLIVNGQKMSKSLGNFYTIRDLMEKGFTGEEIRWVLLSAHYRKKLNFTFESCKKAGETLKNFNSFFARLKSVDNNDLTNQSEIEEIISRNLEHFKNAIGDDMNISEALAAVFTLQKEMNKKIIHNEINREYAHKVLDAYKKFNEILAVFDFSDFEETIPAEVKEIVDERQMARKNRDFKTSDLLRDKLKENGWIVEDTPTGPIVKKL